jgi:hypothetical protein
VQAWQKKLTAAPLPVLFVVQATLFTVLTYLLGVLVERDHQSLMGQAIGGLLFGALMTAWVARQRRRAGGATGVSELAEAVRSGELPDDAEPDDWRPRLLRLRRTYRWLRFVSPFQFGLFAALGAWLAIEQTPTYWLFVAAFVGFGVFGTVASVRGLGRIERLLGRLDAASPTA